MARTNNKNRGKKRQNSSLYGPLSSSKPLPAKAAAHYPHRKRHSQPNNHHNAHQHPVRKRNRSFGGRDTRIPVKQIKFTLRLPPLNSRTSADYTDMPWYQASTNYEYEYTGKSTVKILHHVSADRLQKLDEELLSFAEYVRLTPTECEARDFVISQIADTCRRLFSSRDIEIQAFGSYATKQVCTFASDVDLALWGVVPTNERRHTRFSQTDDTIEEEDQKPAAVDTHDKEDRVQKWKEALAELDAQEKSDDEIIEHHAKQASSGGQGGVASSESVGAASKGTDSKSDIVPMNGRLTDEPTVLEQEAAAIETVCATDATATAIIKPSIDKESLIQEEQPREQDSLFVIDRIGDEMAHEQEIPVGTHPPETKCEPNNMQETQHEGLTRQATAEETKADTSKPLSEAGGSRNAPLDVDVMADGSATAPLEINESDSDADSADKLESYTSRAASTSYRNDDNDDERDNEEKGPFVSLSDSENDDLEVSFVSQASNGPAVSTTSVVGPQGETRKFVLGALKSLGKQLWKSPIIHTVEVRKNARVPIIATGTHLGFEGDIALGGHNGADTSQYASTQAQRFNSFAPVVLFLKVLLGQQELDKPFTGGLGSYKLYVLVAHHLEEHLALGGVDRPSEVLLTFFYRFRKFRDRRNDHNAKASLETLLSQSKTIHCDEGSADLQPIFKLLHCCNLFDESWTRLMQVLESSNSTASLLGKLVHCSVLRAERDQNRNKASKLDRYSSKTNKWPVGQSSSNDRKRSLEETFITGDAEANTLLAGYGMKRGPRGGLIPRNRPDVAAAGQSRMPEAFARATKNRKSKKKQTRDEGLKGIALDYIGLGSAPQKKKQRRPSKKSKKQKQQAAKDKKNNGFKKAGTNSSKVKSKKDRNNKRR